MQPTKPTEPIAGEKGSSMHQTKVYENMEICLENPHTGASTTYNILFMR